MTSFLLAKADKPKSTAAALLLTTSPASDPQRRQSKDSTKLWREPRSPFSRSNSRLLYSELILLMAEIVLALKGALPRLVCRTTPVAFIRGFNFGFSISRVWITILFTISSREESVFKVLIEERYPARVSRIMSKIRLR